MKYNIHEEAGEWLDAECKFNLKPSNADVIITGGYRLPAKCMTSFSTNLLINFGFQIFFMLLNQKLGSVIIFDGAICIAWNLHGIET